MAHYFIHFVRKISVQSNKREANFNGDSILVTTLAKVQSPNTARLTQQSLMTSLKKLSDSSLQTDLNSIQFNDPAVSETVPDNAVLTTSTTSTTIATTTTTTTTATTALVTNVTESVANATTTATIQGSLLILLFRSIQLHSSSVLISGQRRRKQKY